MRTKGKWIYDEGLNEINDTDGFAIAFIRQTNKKTMEANAKLITSAPILLEACEEAKRYICRIGKTVQEIDEVERDHAYTKLQQAVEKAK